MSHAAAYIPKSDALLPEGHPWASLPTKGGVLAGIGVAALAGMLVTGAANSATFAHAWLVAYVYFLSIALGCLYFVLFHNGTQGGWGIVVRRLAENGAATLPVFALLFVPIWLGRHELYSWTHPGHIADEPRLFFKRLWLDETFWTVRALVCFAVWTAIALGLRSLSVKQDDAPNLDVALRMRRFSAPALMPLAITTTIAAVDWLMSLEPHWYSTMFGVYVFSGCLVGGFAFLCVVPIALQRGGALKGIVNAEHYHDLGKLLFAFMVFWAYIGFSQFFLIWYGNIPEETLFFRHRFESQTWLAVSLALAIGHFGVPFFFLMSRTTKRNPKTLAVGALWMLAMHWIDVYWLVMPNLHGASATGIMMSVAALAAVGGVFLAAFGQLLRTGAMVPIGDPRLPESLGFENM